MKRHEPFFIFLFLSCGIFSFQIFAQNRSHDSQSEDRLKLTIANSATLSDDVAAKSAEKSLFETFRAVKEMSQNTSLAPSQREKLRDLAGQVESALQNDDILAGVKESRKMLADDGARELVFDAGKGEVVISDDRTINTLRNANIKPEDIAALKAVQSVQVNALSSEPEILTNSKLLDPVQQLDIVALMLSKSRLPASVLQKPGEKKENKDDEFAKTSSSLKDLASSNAGGTLGSSNLGATSFFVDRSRSLLGVPRSGFDLSSNPFYSPTAGAEIRSVFGDFAMSSGLSGGEPNYADESKKLDRLLSMPSFQALSRKTLGVGATRDLNLMSAGASILTDPEGTEMGAEVAKNFVFNNLSANQFVKSSPVLASLDEGLGAGSLAQLQRKTLEWMALAGNLAFGELEGVPEAYRPKRETYKKAFAELKIWLETLRALDVLNELDRVELPVSRAPLVADWKRYQGIFVDKHFRSAQVLKSSKYAQYLEDSIKRLQTVGRWMQQSQDLDSKRLLVWQKSVYQPTAFSRAWNSGDPLGFAEAKYYFARLYFLSTLEVFLAQKNEPLKVLLEDSQGWAKELRAEGK